MDMNSLPEEDRVKLMKTIDEVQTNVRCGNRAHASFPP